MQSKKMIWVVVSLIAAIAVGFLAGSRRNAESVTATLVKTYNVPFDRAEEVKNSLNHLFSQKDGEMLGSAQVFGNGVMLVRAPEGFQRGVEHLIEQLGTEKTPQRIAIRLDSWLVVGQEDKKSNIEMFPALSTVLSAIDKLDGPRKFRVLEHLSSTGMSGQEVKIKGTAAEVTSMAFTVQTNEALGLRLDFKSTLGNLKTDTQIKAGEYLILGQNAVDPGTSSEQQKIAGGHPTNVYYVVHAEIAK